jgi:hypothetical protein
MNLIKKFLPLLTLFVTSINFAQFTDVINSNRPGKSIAAFSVGKTVIQAELGFYGIKEKHDILNYDAKGVGSELNLRYGAFLEQLEFNLDLQYQNDTYKNDLVSRRRKAFKQTTLGAKYLFYDPNKNYEEKVNVLSWKANHKFSYRSLIPAIGFYAGLNINLSDNEFSFITDPKISPKAMLITQNQFGKFVFVSNIIADKIGTDYPSYGYIITLTRGFTPRWTGYIENQGFQSDFYADNIIRSGAAYLIRENIQIDVNFGVNFKNTPAILNTGIGISWRFDDNYSEVMLRSSKDKSAKDKKGKDKKSSSTDKSKKRVDEVPSQKGK